MPEVTLAYIGSAEASYGAEDELDRCDLQRYGISTGRGAMGNVLRSANPLSYIRVLRFVRRFRPDVIHHSAAHAWNFVLATCIRSCSSVSTIHDPIRHRGEEDWLYAGVAGFEAAVADRIIVLSNAHRGALERFGVNKERVDVIPHGELGSDNAFQPPSNAGRIVFLGRLESYKGTDVLVDAFRLMRNKFPMASLVIAGRGKLTGRLLDVTADERIQIRNKWLSEEEFDQLCLESDIVVLPYLEASQSGVVAKAQALGRAVIVTDVGGLSEQVENGKTGFVIRAGDVAALAESITCALGNRSKLAQMAHAAWSLYRAKYAWPALAQRTLQVYKTAVSDRAIHGPPRISKGLRAFGVGAWAQR